ncbi:hypothetical protein HDU93_001344, partial [Gonapodya sp. JEL0774]
MASNRPPDSSGFFGFDPLRAPISKANGKGKERDLEVDFEKFNSGDWTDDADDDDLYGELGGEMDEDLNELQDPEASELGDLLGGEAEADRANDETFGEDMVSPKFPPQKLGNIIDPENAILNRETFSVGKEEIGGFVLSNMSYIRKNNLSIALQPASTDFDFKAANVAFNRRVAEEHAMDDAFLHDSRTITPQAGSFPVGLPPQVQRTPPGYPQQPRPQPMSAAEVEAQMFARQQRQ